MFMNIHVNKENLKMFKDKPTEQQIKRFWKYVNKKEKNDCWEWIGTKDVYGYGIYSIKSVLYKAHRASYYFENGHIDKNLICCHSCDNPSCVNPHHLWLGTQKQNILDRGKKNRTVTGHLYGEDNPSSKLKKEDVLWIRDNYNPKIWSTRKLAKKYNVCQTKIRQILKRQSWKHI